MAASPGELAESHSSDVVEAARFVSQILDGDIELPELSPKGARGIGVMILSALFMNAAIQGIPTREQQKRFVRASLAATIENATLLALAAEMDGSDDE
jgi:hypothetical protein